MASRLTRNNTVVLIVDTIVSALSSMAAILFVRFLISALPGFSGFFVRWSLLSVAASVISIWITKTNKIIFTYAAFKDVLNILFFAGIKAVLMVLPAVIAPFFDFPRLMLLIVCDFTVTFTGMVCLKSLVFLRPKSLDEEESGAGGLNVVVYGTSQKSIAVVTRYSTSHRYNILGFISRDPLMSGKIVMDYPVWYLPPKEDKLPELGIDAVLFSRREDSDIESERLMKYCIDNGVCLLMVPSAQSTNYPGMDTREIKHLLESQFIPDGMNGVQRSLKRLFDLFFSAVLIVILSPAMLVIALVISFKDGGHVLFRQERIGRFGRPFIIYKFRTMKLDAEAFGPALYSGEDDPRLTRVGRFLRRHHLDELPQLFNVFKGDMSFVGYRPERKVYIDLIVKQDPRYAYLYQIRPGVTSYATLRNGYTDNLEKMLRRLELDLFYLRNRSFGLDFKVLFDTATNVLFGKIF